MEDLQKIKEFFSKPLKEDFGDALEEDAVDTITMDIPLFLRMLEYSREDASQDMDLHDVTEKANALGKERGTLTMDDYDAIVGAVEEIKEVVNYSPEGKDKIYSLIRQALQQGKLTKDAQVVFMKWMADPNSTEEAIIKALESITGGLTEVNLKKGDIVNFANGNKIYIIGPKGDGYEFKTDDNQRSFQLKKWFDMMLSSGKASVNEKNLTEANVPCLEETLVKRVFNRIKNDQSRTKR